MKRIPLPALMLIGVAAIAVGVLVFTEPVSSSRSAVSIARFLAKIALLLGGGLAALIVLLRLWLGPDAARTVILLGTIWCGAAVFGLFAAEFITRVVFRDVTTTGSLSYFTLRWREQNPPDLNSLGFREREFSPVPADDVYRIAVVGDSFTYGQGIVVDSRLSDLLDAKLNTMNTGRFEVLNFGRSGAETVDHLEILKMSVLGVKPDFVLLQWFVNDVEVDKSDRPQSTPLVPSYVLAAFLNRNSALYYLVDRQWWAIQESTGRMENYEDYLVRRYGSLDHDDIRRSDEAMEEFFEILRANDIGVGVVLFPPLDANADTRLGFLLDHVAAVCRGADVPVIDLRSALATAESPTDLWANRFDNHPGRLANELAAAEVLRELGERWQAGKPQVVTAR